MHHRANERQLLVLGVFIAIAVSACGATTGLDDFPCDFEGRCPGLMRCDTSRSVCLAGTGCPAPLTECGGKCTATSGDKANCGACGHACTGTETCVDGACKPGSSGTCAFCSPGLECVNGQCACGGRGDLCLSAFCVDLQQSSGSCGTCLQPCQVSGTSCRAGQCVCAPGEKVCGTRCIDVSSDPANCGDCAHACTGTNKCEKGMCVPACTINTTNACGDGKCWDTTSNHQHCGASCSRCSNEQACVSGACACPAGAEVCSSKCTVTRTDPLNCGTCGHACGAGESCVNGQCTCQGKLTNCGGTCTLLTDDPANCGACGTSCTGRVCANGSCADGCPLGWQTCNGACIDAMNDPKHCGGCSSVCDPGEVCVDGSCEKEKPALGCTSCPCDYCTFTLDALCCTRGGAPYCIASLRCPP